MCHCGSPVEREKDCGFAILTDISNLEASIEERIRRKKTFLKKKKQKNKIQQQLLLKNGKRKHSDDDSNDNDNNNESNDNNNDNRNNDNDRNDNNNNNVTLRNFVSFIKTLFEDINTLSENQLRFLFSLIFQNCCVAVEKITVRNNEIRKNDNSNNCNDNSDSNKGKKKQPIRSLWTFSPPDDVMILLKKYSGSVERRLRRLSIIGYVAYLCQSRAFTSSLER